MRISDCSSDVCSSDLTFTNKSAREMLTRLSALLPINTRGLWVGTFHGLCNRLLRAHHRDAGLIQTFQILDSADQLAAIKRLLKGAGIDDDKFPPRYVDRKSVVEGKRVSVRVDLGGRSIIKKKNKSNKMKNKAN